MFPNTAIVGSCNIGPNTILAQGHSIINADTPGNCVVFNKGGVLSFKQPKEDYLARFFRTDEEAV